MTISNDISYIKSYISVFKKTNEILKSTMAYYVCEGRNILKKQKDDLLQCLMNGIVLGMMTYINAYFFLQNVG